MHDPLYRPGFQTRQQLCMEVRHISFEKCQCVQRKNDSEAVGRVRRILLEDVNLPIAKAALDQQREEQPGRPGSDNVNQHRSTISKSTLSIGVMDYAPYSTTSTRFISPDRCRAFLRTRSLRFHATAAHPRNPSDRRPSRADWFLRLE